jgi:hypothetical protein
MKAILASAAVITAVAMMPATASAGERVGDAALGALAGGLVFGPVGAIAGAAVGYTNGPGIAHGLGVHHHYRHYHHRARHHRSHDPDYRYDH